MTTVSDDDVLCTVTVFNAVFHSESYRQFLLVLSAPGGVIPTAPPGGCLRQALDNSRNILSTANSGRGIMYSYSDARLNFATFTPQLKFTQQCS